VLLGTAVSVGVGEARVAAGELVYDLVAELVAGIVTARLGLGSAGGGVPASNTTALLGLAGLPTNMPHPAANTIETITTAINCFR